MAVLRFLLFPFAALYDLVTTARNRLYDLQFRPSVQFEIPVVSVGNLAVGGTGKTPMIEYLVRLLQGRSIATLSRGYGRKSKGFRVATPHDTADSIGDEPLQLYRKFGERVIVTVGEERVMAIPNIMDQFPETAVILLDDAFQHRKVKPGLNILLTDYHRQFCDDHIMPMGRLRESRDGAGRADIVVVTKCPQSVTDDDIMQATRNIRRYAKAPVFFSRIRYGRANPVIPGTVIDRVVLISGIANAEPLEDYVRQHYKLVKHIRFGDHHGYTQRDIQRVLASVPVDQSIGVLTTEKDLVKLSAPGFDKYWRTYPLLFLPIELEFVKNGKEFDALVLNNLKRGT
jgi:tetraacyldisaccharide 4'-kinase